MEEGDNYDRRTEAFFEKLTQIQKYCVDVAMSKVETYDSTENMLKDVTCEAIYRVMEYFDGYGGALAKYKIINMVSGEIINTGIELYEVNKV